MGICLSNVIEAILKIDGTHACSINDINVICHLYKIQETAKLKAPPN